MTALPSLLRRLLPALLLTTVAAACGKPQPLGDANAIIAAVPDEIWAQVEQEVYAALEPRAFTVRDERIFRVTQVDPASQQWNDLRRFRQILLIGEPGDPTVAEALEQVDRPHPAPPTVVRARNVWAQGQQVTVALLPPGSRPEAAQPLLAVIGETLRSQYENLARQRMFVTGADSALADSLRRSAGFSLLVPQVYRFSQPESNVYLFRNDQPDPSRLIRSVLVAWRPAGEVTPTQESALAWREQIGERFYEPPQVTETERIESRELGTPERGGMQIQGVWSNPPGGWPAGGPFIARIVPCPEQQRVYLLDGWIYAPGTEKYEYMVQLNTIMDSFRCANAVQ